LRYDVKKKCQTPEKKISKLAWRITRNEGKIRPSFKTWLFFGMMRQMQKRGWNEADVEYWKKKGWTGKARPWK